MPRSTACPDSRPTASRRGAGGPGSRSSPPGRAPARPTFPSRSNPSRSMSAAPARSGSARAWNGLRSASRAIRRPRGGPGARGSPRGSRALAATSRWSSTPTGSSGAAAPSVSGPVPPLRRWCGCGRAASRSRWPTAGSGRGGEVPASRSSCRSRRSSPCAPRAVRVRAGWAFRSRRDGGASRSRRAAWTARPATASPP